MECHCALEYLDENHLLKGYVLGELGYVYECMGELQQANHYYTTALSFSREKQIPLLAIYSLDHLVHMMLILCQRKGFKKLNNLLWTIGMNQPLISVKVKLIIECLYYRRL